LVTTESAAWTTDSCELAVVGGNISGVRERPVSDTVRGVRRSDAASCIFCAGETGIVGTCVGCSVVHDTAVVGGGCVVGSVVVEVVVEDVAPGALCDARRERYSLKESFFFPVVACSL